jgi:hypothetical protein
MSGRSARLRNRLALGIIAATLAVTAVDCTKSTAPTAPSMVSTPAPTMFNLHGTVSDSISRPVSNARVELVDGPQAGQVATTDMDGQFAFAPFTASATTVTLRVTRDGYAPFTVTAVGNQINSFLDHLTLQPLTHVDPTGEYQFTLTAAAACDALPPAVRTRRYTATAVITGPTGGMVTLGGADLVPHYDAFGLTRADNAVRFSLFSAYAFASWLDDDPIVERLDATSYVAFSGTATVMPWNPDQSMAAVDGTIAYCAAAKEASAPIYPPTCLVPPVECQSSSHRLSLVRR